MSKFKRLIADKSGSEAVGFLLTTALLILIFATIISAFVYILQYYSASTMCQKLVRSIEIQGEYDEAEAQKLLLETASPELENIVIELDAAYLSGNKIQLRTPFTLRFSASYKISILKIGDVPVEISLPITIRARGMSEVYWKT